MPCRPRFLYSKRGLRADIDAAVTADAFLIIECDAVFIRVKLPWLKPLETVGYISVRIL